MSLLTWQIFCERSNLDSTHARCKYFQHTPPLLVSRVSYGAAGLLITPASRGPNLPPHQFSASPTHPTQGNKATPTCPIRTNTSNQFANGSIALSLLDQRQSNKRRPWGNPTRRERRCQGRSPRPLVTFSRIGELLPYRCHHHLQWLSRSHKPKRSTRCCHRYQQRASIPQETLHLAKQQLILLLLLSRLIIALLLSRARRGR